MDELLELIKAIGGIQFTWGTPFPGKELYQDGWNSASWYIYGIVSEYASLLPKERHKLYLSKMKEIKDTGGSHE